MAPQSCRTLRVPGHSGETEERNDETRNCLEGTVKRNPMIAVDDLNCCLPSGERNERMSPHGTGMPGLFPVARMVFASMLELTILISCGSGHDRKQTDLNEGVVAPIELLLDTAACVTEVQLGAVQAIQGFYSRNGYVPIWSSDGRLLPAADTMIHIIKTVRYYGLLLNRFHRNDIEDIRSGPRNPFREALIDILLTDTFMNLAFQLRHGQFADYGLHGFRNTINLSDAVASNSIREVLESQEPHLKEYQALKRALKRILDHTSGDSTLAGYDNESAIKILSINMDRWRNQPIPVSGTYILINIPSYSLKVIAKDSTVLMSRVIVGKPETATPVLSSAISCFTVYPTWNVPRKIAVEEILPIIRSDTSYLRRNHFDLIGERREIVDPSSVTLRRYTQNDFPFSLRQREGPENTLGILKFQFENPYSVYLHDTNARNLFLREMRALSHGCIRMEKAKELAYYLAQEGFTEAGPDELSRAIASRKHLEIDLHEPVPIYVRYFTAVSDNDNVQLYDDVYGEDEMFIRIAESRDRETN